MKLVFKALPTSLAGFAFFLSCTTSSLTLALPDNDVRGLTQQQEVQCGLRIGEKRMTAMTSTATPSDDRHRRMVSLDGLPQSCEESEVITIDIPHDGMKRTFNKVGTSKNRNSGPVPSDYAYWSGEDSKDGSTFNFVQDEEGNMAGSMVDLTNDNVLQFHQENGGAYVVTITASSDFPPEGDEDEEDETPSGSGSVRKLLREAKVKGSARADTAATPIFSTAIPPSVQQIGNTKPLSRKLYDDNGGNLDVMVVWTKKSECRLSGLSVGCTTTASTAAAMQTMLNLAVQETNEAYSLSGVDTEILLVHSYQHPTYVESSFSGSLGDVRDNRISGVHSNRDRYGADIVALIIDDSQYCGIANLGPRIDLMYSVTAWNCATGYYSFGHEIGHNLGLNHDRGTRNTCGGGGYNYGYRDPEGSFRTTLGYSCRTDQCDNNAASGCTRIKRYSTPDRTYNGKVLGTADANNVRAINDVRVAVAGYKTHVTEVPPSVSPTPTGSPTPFVFPRPGTVGPIECDQTVGGDTTNGENIYGNASPEHFYSFSLDAADRVTFSSCGSAFDTYIRIYSSNGVQLAYNDDVCGTQSVIAVSLEAGVYYVMMEGFSSYVGVYTMAMTCGSSPPTASPMSSSTKSPVLPNLPPSAAPTASPTSSPTRSPVLPNLPPSAAPTAKTEYTIDGPGWNSGIIVFKESQTPGVAITEWNPLTRQYMVEVTLPTTASCPIAGLYGKTFYFVLPGTGCFRVQLFNGGTLEFNPTDTICSQDTFISRATFSLFSSLNEGANNAVFIDGPNEYSGTFSFKDSITATELSNRVTAFNGATKEYAVEITLPVEECRSPSTP